MLHVSVQQAKYNYRLAYLSAFSASYAFYKGHYHLVHVPGGIWLTSMLYWWHPVRGWRRNLDIIYVQYAFLYQAWHAIVAEYARAYFILIALAVASYPLSIWYGSKAENKNKQFQFHYLIHIFANIANIVLYSGYI